MLLEIALLVVLSRPEMRCGYDLGDDRLVEEPLCLFFGLSGCLLLLRVVEEDHRPVLMTMVGSLPVEGRGIVHVPESVEQLVVCELGGVICDFDRLSVASSS